MLRALHRWFYLIHKQPFNLCHYRTEIKRSRVASPRLQTNQLQSLHLNSFRQTKHHHVLGNIYPNHSFFIYFLFFYVFEPHQRNNSVDRQWPPKTLWLLDHSFHLTQRTAPADHNLNLGCSFTWQLIPINILILISVKAYRTFFLLSLLAEKNLKSVKNIGWD